MILGVIQARMSSTRLPGKVLLPVLEKPIIAHIYERMKFSKKIDLICVSTSENSTDDKIEEFCKQNGIEVFRGSEENLVSRHLGAAKKYNADTIVRITADCPFVDPEIIDELLELFEKNPNADYITNTIKRTYPIGLDVEVIPTRVLEQFLPKSENSTFYEYFIGLHMIENQNEFKCVGLELPEKKTLRWTIDYEEDYKFVKKIYSLLYKKNKIFLMKDIMIVLKKHPEIEKINSMHVKEFSYLKYQREING
ncbi:MAG: glycosyltransferase family protein [Nitrosopumilus sp.]|nr:glycosyltransferase family protein [Nitrosopumilus sp.]